MLWVLWQAKFWLLLLWTNLTTPLLPCFFVSPLSMSLYSKHRYSMPVALSRTMVAASKAEPYTVALFRLFLESCHCLLWLTNSAIKSLDTEPTLEK